MPPANTLHTAPIVALRGVGKTFPSGTVALAGLDLDVREGEFLSLLGPSGCGKSTALRIIAGLSEPTQGAVEWTAAAKTENENRIGFVFQEPTLMPWANVFNNVLLPLKLKSVPADKAGARVEAALERVGLQKFANAYPRELSGGMRMRVSIARALVTEPALLLMDEPFAALDEITRFKLNNDLLQVWQALRTTVVFVTHSVFESVYLSSRIVVMAARPGRVFTELAIDAPYPRDQNFRTSAEYAALCRAHLGGAGASHGGGRRAMTQRSSAHERRDRVLRIALPIVVLALSLAAWELVVRIADIPPYVLPAPSLILQTFIADEALLSQSLLVTLHHDARGFFAGGDRRRRTCGAVQPVAAGRIFALSLRGDPAGDADRRHRAAAADLSAAAARRCWPAPGSWRSFRCWPTPRSGSIRSTAISPTCSRSMAPRAARCCGT